MADNIHIRGAREHNLKNVTLDLPRDALIVFTGISGSGKSSLAFDTIYAEGQRRYVESLSAYARQFLGQMEKPDVDIIEGLSPAISIDQKSASRNPRSTVGTITEVYDYLRLLYARIGHPHCHQCGRPIARQTVEQITDSILGWKSGTTAHGPRARREGTERASTSRCSATSRARASPARASTARCKDLSEKIQLERYKQHTIEVVVDRIVLKDGIRSRLADSLETAMGLTQGVVDVEIVDADASRGRTPSRRTSRACSAGSASRSSRRGSSRSTPRTARAPTAPVSGTSSRSTRSSSSRTRTCRSRRARSTRGPAAGSSTSSGCSKPSAKRSASTTTKPWKKLSKTHKDVLLYGSGDEQVYIRYKSRYGRKRSYYTYYEGVIPWLTASPRGDRVGVRARAGRAVHARDAVSALPRVRGCSRSRSR